jgi:hypothetical protein
MRMHGDSRAGVEASTVNGPIGHWLRQWHEFDARKKIDLQPLAILRIRECLSLRHCEPPAHLVTSGYYTIVT